MLLKNNNTVFFYCYAFRVVCFQLQLQRNWSPRFLGKNTLMARKHNLFNLLLCHKSRLINSQTLEINVSSNEKRWIAPTSQKEFIMTMDFLIDKPCKVFSHHACKDCNHTQWIYQLQCFWT